MKARRTWLLACCVAALAVIGLVWWWVVAGQLDTGHASGQEHDEPESRGDSTDHDHDRDDDHAHAVEETGPDVWRETSAEGEYLEIADTPARFVALGLNLASAWVTFDSRDSEFERQKQLGEHIPNPEEWTALPPDLLNAESQRAVSRTSGGSEVDENWTFSADGTHSVSIDVPFTVRYFGRDAPNTLTRTWNWSFVFDDEGRLVDVEGPEK